ncbi:hypothetical protein BG842_25085 [Haladaptatus sp. W1]|nr:hypothetical protein BG842_17780 [Haladaptatus sp. W1]ODR83502.1 hypothetical protein BG842_25085 [Haladaptatus sp. W1]
MISRRQVLAGTSSLALISLAGCSGSESGGSDTIDCHTSASQHGDGDVLDGGAMATVHDGNVYLTIPLSVEKVKHQNVTSLRLYDPSGQLKYTIPVSPLDTDVMQKKLGVSPGQLQYQQYIGPRPYNGQYRILAIDKSGNAVDTVTVGFNCFADTN